MNRIYWENLIKKTEDISTIGSSSPVYAKVDRWWYAKIKALGKNWFSVLVSIAAIVAAVFSVLNYFK